MGWRRSWLDAAFWYAAAGCCGDGPGPRTRPPLTEDPLIPPDNENRPQQRWAPDDVCAWLEHIGLPECIAAFHQRGITGPMFAAMSPEELHQLGAPFDLSEVVRSPACHHVISSRPNACGATAPVPDATCWRPLQLPCGQPQVTPGRCPKPARGRLFLGMPWAMPTPGFALMDSNGAPLTGCAVGFCGPLRPQSSLVPRL
jgi:hypothetical protein